MCCCATYVTTVTINSGHVVFSICHIYICHIRYVTSVYVTFFICFIYIYSTSHIWKDMSHSDMSHEYMSHFYFVQIHPRTGRMASQIRGQNTNLFTTSEPSLLMQSVIMQLPGLVHDGQQISELMSQNDAERNSSKSSMPNQDMSQQTVCVVIAKRPRTDSEILEQKDLALKRHQLYVAKISVLRDTQKEAMTCIEGSTCGTLILMPTGSGKTTLIWTHKVSQECSVIFAPYRVLVSQLQDTLSQKGTTVCWPFNEEQQLLSIDGIIANAEYVIFPFEAVPACIPFIEALNRSERLGPLWVDEVSMCHDICH